MNLCPPEPNQLINTCFSHPAIIALGFGGLSILIGLILLILILKAKNKKAAHYSLLTYIITTVIAGPAVGIMVILAPNPGIINTVSQVFIIVNLFMMYSYYWFLDTFLANKKKGFLLVSTIVITILSVLILAKPDSFLLEISWSQQLGWYDFAFQKNLFFLIIPALPIYFPLSTGIIRLFQAFRKTKSPIKRNRIKYIALAAGIYMCGWLMYMPSIQSFRYIPFDAFAAVISGVLLTYTIIHLNLLDISVVIRKGLLYTTLTTVVTGTYLLLAFIIQSITGITGQPISVSSAITTALFVAFIFQPLQNITQTVIDKVFFRRKYDPNLLLSRFSEAVASTIERAELASKTINLIYNTVQIKQAFLLLKNPNDNTLTPIYQKSMRLPDNFRLYESDPIINWLKANQGVLGYHDEISPDLSEFMRKFNTELIIPLVSKNQMIGIIGFGQKMSDMLYSIEEYSLFNSLANQMAIAFENSNLLENVRQEKRKVEKALEREKEVDKEKSEFISIASHNLRTPLTIALGYIDNMIFEKKYSDSDQKHLQAVFSSLNRLSVITEELLIISQNDEKDMPYTFQKENYLDIVDNVISKYKPLAEEKGLVIEYKKPKIAPAEISLDKAKIDLALSNLVDNAIKFTEKGTVTITVFKKEKNIIFEVRDTGKGIPKENIKNLFSKFYQGKKSQYDYIPGIGTGLYVTKLIVKAHNGEVWVKSEVEKGSIFSMSLPINGKDIIVQNTQLTVPRK